MIVLVLLALAVRVHAEPSRSASPAAGDEIDDDADEPDDDADEPDDPDEPDDTVSQRDELDPPAVPVTHNDFDLLADHDDTATDAPPTGALSMLDAEHTPGGATAGDDASFAAAAAGANEAYEAWLRDRPSARWGRFDLGIALRRRNNVPAHTPAYQTGELWLVATWRR